MHRETLVSERWISCNMHSCTVSSNFLLEKGHVTENVQKACLCYCIIKDRLRQLVSNPRRQWHSLALRSTNWAILELEMEGLFQI